MAASKTLHKEMVPKWDLGADEFKDFAEKGSVFRAAKNAYEDRLVSLLLDPKNKTVLKVFEEFIEEDQLAKESVRKRVSIDAIIRKLPEVGSLNVTAASSNLESVDLITSTDAAANGFSVTPLGHRISYLLKLDYYNRMSLITPGFAAELRESHAEAHGARR